MQRVTADILLKALAQPVQRFDATEPVVKGGDYIV
jgi:hypothetical protein